MELLFFLWFNMVLHVCSCRNYSKFRTSWSLVHLLSRINFTLLLCFLWWSLRELQDRLNIMCSWLRLVSLLMTCSTSSILSRMCKSSLLNNPHFHLQKQICITITKILFSLIIGSATNGAQVQPQLVTLLL